MLESHIGGGHVSTANKRTYPAMALNGCLATYGGAGNWGTILDLFSDVLSTRPGQKIFFNITKNDPVNDLGSNKDLDTESEEMEPDNFLKFCGGEDVRGKYGFTGIFEVAGKPRFDSKKLETGYENATLEEDYAIRVPVKPVKIFKDVFEEWLLLDVLDQGVNVWQPRYRKFLNAPKSLTSLTPEESGFLVDVLEEEIENNINGDELDVSPLREGEEISISNRLDQVRG